LQYCLSDHDRLAIHHSGLSTLGAARMNPALYCSLYSAIVILTLNSAILSKMASLFFDCVAQHHLSGYVLETENIAIAFWPRTSIMEEQYGHRASAALTFSNSTALSSS